MVTLDILSNSICDLSKGLLQNYKVYWDPETSLFEKKQKFNQFVQTWQELYDYKINIQNTIYQYYDLYVGTINKIGPNRNEKAYYAYKSAGSTYISSKETYGHWIP